MIINSILLLRRRRITSIFRRHKLRREPEKATGSMEHLIEQCRPVRTRSTIN
ncbi:hypothetical protein LINPERPRIM_LOCUS8399 [Linum perenne]